MKPIFILLLSFFSFLSLEAQSNTPQTYESLWDRVEEASRKDKPKSALNQTERIRQKAIAEQNPAQLLRALLMQRLFGGEIAPDSALVYAKEIKKAMANATEPTEKAMWHSALAQLIERCSSDELYLFAGVEPDGQTPNKNEVATQHYRLSLEPQLELAKTPTKSFAPVLKQGNKWGSYGDNLLQVLATAYIQSSAFNLLEEEKKTAFYDSLKATYLAIGNRPMALYQTLAQERLKLKEENHRIEVELDEFAPFCRLRTIAKEYADLPENVHTYEMMVDLKYRYEELGDVARFNDSLLVRMAEEGIELYGNQSPKNRCNKLRNFLRYATQPKARLSEIPSVTYPNSEVQLNFQVRHADKVDMALIRLHDSSADFSQLSTKEIEALIRRHRKQATHQTLSFPKGLPAYAWHQEPVKVDMPTEPGVYAAVLTLNGKETDKSFFHISRIRPITFSYAPGHNRIAILDSRTGRPVAGAKVTAYKQNSKHPVKTYSANEDGTVEIDLTANDRRDNLVYYASTANDKGSEAFFISSLHFYRNSGEKARTSVDLFTDRAIYRPGQEIGFSAIAYTRLDDDFKVEAGLEGEAKLYNANYKKIDSLLVKTDSLGTLSGSFKLPDALLPGRFHIEIKYGGQSATTHFRVEEYKRPTFSAETEPVKTAYSLGDSVRVEGKATTYSGVPVADAKVTYQVTRSTWFGWSNRSTKPQTGKTRTDEEGRFSLPVLIEATKSEASPRRFNSFYYQVNYTVTADNGETFSGSTMLRAASRPAWLSVDMPERLCKEELQPIVVKQTNAAGEEMKVKGSFTLTDSLEKQVAAGFFTTGEPLDEAMLKSLPSGSYKLQISSSTEGVETDSAILILFSKADRSPADKKNPFFVYSKVNEPTATAEVLVGSPKRGALIFYDIVTTNGTIESKRFEVSDSLLHFDFAYRPEYGDGATLFLAMLSDNRLYQHEITLRRPEPQKQLELHWTSFRSRLQPGQQEEWTLQIQHPDGSPANANLMAVLFDASLDAFARNDWNWSNISFYRRTPNALWNRSGFSYDVELNTSVDFSSLETFYPQFPAWNDRLFLPTWIRAGGRYFSENRLLRMPLRMRGTTNVSNLEEEVMDATAEIARESSFAAAPMAKQAAKAEAGATQPTVTPRSNFAETAFFRPALRTDKEGNVRIAFTLPESMTKWNFMALAHDREMNHGRLDTTIVARKDFMVEPAMPRFVREGDEAEIPVKVTNLTDRPLEARIVLTVEDALNAGKQLFQREETAQVAAGRTAVCSFIYKVGKDDALLTVKAIGTANSFSDGEEHSLPVLSSETRIVRTLPFSLTEAGTKTLEIDSLFSDTEAGHRSLTVEVASNPTWFAVTALPTLAGNSRSLSATEWATRYYALALGHHLAALYPEIKALAKADGAADALTALKLEGLDDLTPWLREMQAEAGRGRALRELFDPEIAAAKKQTAIDKLRSLQGSDGAWSWYPGMPGNAYITVDVSILLARIQKIAASQSVDALFLPAYKFLQEEIAREVKAMKKEEREMKLQIKPTELQLRYLYLRSLLGERPDADARFLLDRAKRLRHELTMYGKAVSAIVLAEGGEEDAAKLALESLMEHSVSYPEMGRYFDSPRAEWSWSSYRIPTQCATIEALDYFGRREEANDFRLWLMQAKRTQMWETSRASSDAVYALLTASADSTSKVMALGSQTPVYYTLYKGREIVALNDKSQAKAPESVGYFKETYTDEATTSATTLKLHKSTEGLSWGSVYAHFSLPASRVKTEGKGLTLLRSYEKWVDGRWVKADDGDRLEKGDRLRQIFVITADRDYDFVHIESARPANLEPRRPLSGYQWDSSLPAYRAVYDAHTDYFIERLRKGTHRFSEELFVNRAGRYASGISRINCVYAPEFCGTSAEITLESGE